MSFDKTISLWCTRHPMSHESAEIIIPYGKLNQITWNYEVGRESFVGHDWTHHERTVITECQLGYIMLSPKDADRNMKISIGCINWIFLLGFIEYRNWNLLNRKKTTLSRSTWAKEICSCFSYPHPMNFLIRKSKDYVYGIWVYEVLGIWKGYYKVKTSLVSCMKPWTK